MPEGSTRIAQGTGDVSPLGEVIRVTAVIRGDQGVIYLNGEPVDYIQDPYLDSAARIVWGCTSASEAVCEFDNVKFWNLGNLPQ